MNENDAFGFKRLFGMNNLTNNISLLPMLSIFYQGFLVIITSNEGRQSVSNISFYDFSRYIEE